MSECQMLPTHRPSSPGLLLTMVEGDLSMR
ncbi:hypothetical protein GBAR_LOCUS2265 [Geodia barretti]|uniref:Uncharacterized protein n=1 Tax=Geodia barretti TaxID=519541 RepID=A0AA35R0A6_GEOBA|nr:hypothetical protein GBAR_LOCUS2265 [Geodia barretti]